MKENRPNRQSNTQAKATRGTRKEQPSARLVVAYALLQMMRQSAYSNLVAESRFDALESPRDAGLCLHPVLWGAGAARSPCGALWLPYCRKPVRKLDPEVLCILEMGLYQLLFLDSVPERAAVNESVLLTRKLGKQSAGGFVNGVLRAFIRDGKPLCPGAEKLSPLERLSAEASAHGGAVPAADGAVWRGDSPALPARFAGAGPGLSPGEHRAHHPGKVPEGAGRDGHRRGGDRSPGLPAAGKAR